MSHVIKHTFQNIMAFFNPPDSARLEAIFIAHAAGQPMKRLELIHAIEGQGLKGDRYQTRQGYWDPVEGCQLTIITQYELDKAQKKSAHDLSTGQHRRNLVISGLHPKKLMRYPIQIGEAVFQYHKPRPPCGYLDQLVGKGTAKSLGKHSGACFKVVKTGLLHEKDKVQILA